jgi:hypothetical protein
MNSIRTLVLISVFGSINYSYTVITPTLDFYKLIAFKPSKQGDPDKADELANILKKFTNRSWQKNILVNGLIDGGIVEGGMVCYRPALHYVSSTAKLALLLEAGAEVNGVDSLGYTASHVFAEKGDFELLR